MLISGANCSINTDDELLFNTNLTKELQTLINRGIINYLDILKLQQNAAHAAFIDQCQRERILNKLSLSWHNLLETSEIKR